MILIPTIALEIQDPEREKKKKKKGILWNGSPPAQVLREPKDPVVLPHKGTSHHRSLQRRRLPAFSSLATEAYTGHLQTIGGQGQAHGSYCIISLLFF